MGSSKYFLGLFVFFFTIGDCIIPVRCLFCRSCNSIQNDDDCQTAHMCKPNEACTEAIIVGRRHRADVQVLCSACCNKDVCKTTDCQHIGISPDNCSPNPCAHGTCTNYGDHPVCTCNSGYMGNKCDIVPSTGCSTMPCVHGTCTKQGTQFTCQCDSGYMGVACDQVMAVDHCTSNPCLHGTCSNSASSFTCTCHSGYSGQTCDLQINQDPCSPNPCVHGQCVRDGTSTFHCDCKGSYHGAMCDIGCPSLPTNCHGGTLCIKLDKNFCKTCRPECLG